MPRKVTDDTYLQFGQDRRDVGRFLVGPLGEQLAPPVMIKHVGADRGPMWHLILSLVRIGSRAWRLAARRRFPAKGDILPVAAALERHAQSLQSELECGPAHFPGEQAGRLGPAGRGSDPLAGVPRELCVKLAHRCDQARLGPGELEQGIGYG
jgi:hypothetical protein